MHSPAEYSRRTLGTFRRRMTRDAKKLFYSLSAPPVSLFGHGFARCGGRISLLALRLGDECRYEGLLAPLTEKRATRPPFVAKVEGWRLSAAQVGTRRCSPPRRA